MRDLRVRFGALLALSLLPLLIFAMVQSYFVFKSDTYDREVILQATALNAAEEVVATLDDAKLVLKIVGNTVDANADCDASLNKIIRTAPWLDSLEIVARSGFSICQANAANGSNDARDFNRLLTVEAPFLVEKRAVRTGNPSSKIAVSTSYGVFDRDGLLRVAVANFELDGFATLASASFLKSNARVSILNSRGESLAGYENLDPSMRLEWINIVKSEGQYKSRFVDDAGKTRDIFVIETGSLGTYLAISEPGRSFLSWSVLNPFSSVVMLVLALLFSLGAIWLATDTLILAHLRKMQRSMLNFSSGDLSERVGALNNPPKAIKVLGEKIDVMADRIEQREAAITDALDEKETLLREIHHRVKNNLQIIISLLNMQERKLKDKNSRAAIIETRSRINAIALVHKGLYENPDLRFVDMQTFLDRLVVELSVALGLKKRRVQTHVVANCEPMEADTATPVALFIVEALTNSIKHGVQDGGEIDIDILEETGVVTVSVSDNGKNPSPMTSEDSGTGTKLIKGFARQLGGDVRIEDNDNGYSVTLKFAKRAA